MARFPAGFPKVGPPPPAKRLPTISATPVPPTVARRSGVSFQLPRVVFVIGAPSIGKTTYCRIARSASTMKIAHLEAGSLESEAVGAAVEEARADGTKIFLIEGFPRTAVHTLWTYDQRLVSPSEGAILRLEHNLIVDPTFAANMREIDQVVRDLALPFGLVHTENPETGIADLCRRAWIED